MGDEIKRCGIEGCESPVCALDMCVKHYQRQRAHGDPMFTKRGLRVEKACKCCGLVMRLKPAKAKQRLYCSRACQAKGSVLSKGLSPRADSMTACLGCGLPVTRPMRAKDAAKFCGRSCYGVWKVKAHDERWSELRHAKEAERARLAVVQPELDALHRMARYVERPSRRKCAGCDALVINRKWARFCPSCREAGKKSAARRLKLTPAYKALKLKHKTLRRARQEIEAEAVNPYVVFHKAGWKCQICGVDTPRRLRGTYEPNAPELDHIVPLAKGGGHTWANVQCSCRRCNGAKGASLAA